MTPEFLVLIVVVLAIFGPLFVPQDKPDNTWCSDAWDKEP